MASPVLHSIEQNVESKEAPEFIGEQPTRAKDTLHKTKHTAYPQSETSAAEQARQQNINCHQQQHTLQPRHRDV